MEIIIVPPSQDCSEGPIGMYEMCLAQILAQRGFVSLFSMKAVLSASIWVTGAPVFLRDRMSPWQVLGCFSGRVRCRAETRRRCWLSHGRHGSERRVRQEVLQPGWNN